VCERKEIFRKTFRYFRDSVKSNGIDEFVETFEGSGDALFEGPCRLWCGPVLSFVCQVGPPTGEKGKPNIRNI